eukprot:TRINITY_DN77_c0_g1_i1.p1 TRINITY_DN77_c0_g1~~TRINITY_DN77_c0_g1_i1.p1  ORF type:complete len:392 (+),score=84.32 TRINITY_DN77_c0_g1_i1:183-1358(+)
MNSPKQSRNTSSSPSRSPLSERNHRPHQEVRKVRFSETTGYEYRTKASSKENRPLVCEDTPDVVEQLEEFLQKEEAKASKAAKDLLDQVKQLSFEKNDLARKLALEKDENDRLKGSNANLEGRLKANQKNFRDLNRRFAKLQCDLTKLSEKCDSKINKVKETYGTKVENLRNERETVIAKSLTSERELRDKIFRIQKETRTQIFDLEMELRTKLANKQAENANLKRDFQTSQARIARLNIDMRVARKQREKVRFVSKLKGSPSRIVSSPTKSGADTTQPLANEKPTVDPTKPFIFDFNSILAQFSTPKIPTSSFATLTPKETTGTSGETCNTTNTDSGGAVEPLESSPTKTEQTPQPQNTYELILTISERVGLLEKDVYGKTNQKGDAQPL